MGAMDPPAVNEVGMHEAVDARPIHRVYVDGFWMDRTDVTNEEFARFVKATKYVTIAERAPTAEEFPGAPPENLVAGSDGLFPPDHPVSLNNHFSGGHMSKGRIGGIRKASAVTSRDAKSFPWFRWPTRTLWRTPSGRTSVCPPKQNGSLQRAGVWQDNALSMGRRIPAERQVDGKHLPGTFPCERHRL